ncbi:MAG: CBS domain-containing protein [Gammaproteobacteria bacterium]|uniref:DUF294 nucleotidyltransferase-like domain-containing protein n=1 Tax=Rhodoferax sp. TaxID=50421 RepID=UPI001841873D|nr:DUF294 nucleotidyltransferase-like domain-containing protein [Rhodoferax sp.]MBU3900689.1 CBS domain-containing protein [Gammaproteobacteria bacterium]MBA3059677.1 CBS domain-containing protein [Rhodoferax sp.]MBU3998385.1 CBS domain-containing protein [Gammaproteobacteria bacterium]MBU4081347.1 CBS domain-containing protein [Gammaproteobacteria bacterium]MBU4112340.1 CBS domain-containing protein [Gammaproteobacteria bacterium]
MPNAFNFSASPFDCLSPDEQRLVRDSVDVAYFRQGETILDIGIVPTHLFVIIKGFVTQLEGSEVITTYGPDDCFDGRGLVAGKVSSRFVATEELVVYLLTHQAVSDLIASNATFGALLFCDLGKKLSALSDRKCLNQQQSLSLSRVDEAFVRPAHFVDADTDVLSVVKLLHSQRIATVLVRDTASQPPRVGIFTATTLHRAILDGRPLDQQRAGDLANFSLVEVRPSDQLGDVIDVLLRRRVHRVVVSEGGEIKGFLEALDLCSFLSNQSHLITMHIEEARNLPALSMAAAQITGMIAMLHRGGSRVNLIAKLVQQLNARLFERAWNLVAPADLVSNSCLFVMGSEGRGEQLLKTDQDNALILRDGYAVPENIDAICQAFSAALAGFGYPKCPGNIMVSNPQWRQNASEFGQMGRQWLIMPSPDSLMNLAIFMDAHAVCGDPHLLEDVQNRLMLLATASDVMLSRFASAIELFGSHSGWWNLLLGKGDADHQLNLKKEGIFPLVHGVRSLALANQVKETNTSERIAVLVAAGQLDANMGTDLTDSLHFFMGLTLKTGLMELDMGKAVSGTIDVTRLSSLDRDLLKDTLNVVKRFKAMLRRRFHLDAMT